MAAQHTIAGKPTGPIGLEVLMHWSGDVHMARFYPRPADVTVGENGEFGLPADLLGGKSLAVLVTPHPEAGFALQLGEPLLRGTLEVGAEVHDLADLRRDKLGQTVALVPLFPGTVAKLQVEDFAFTLRRSAVPPPMPAGHNWRQGLALVGFGAAALVVVAIPLAIGVMSAADRDRTLLSYADQLAETTRTLFEVDVPVPQEPADVVQPEQPNKELQRPIGPQPPVAEQRLAQTPPAPAKPKADPDADPDRVPGPGPVAPLSADDKAKVQHAATVATEGIERILVSTVPGIGLPGAALRPGPGTDTPGGPDWQGGPDVVAKVGADPNQMEKPTSGPKKIGQIRGNPTIVDPNKQEAKVTVRPGEMNVEGGLPNDVVRRYIETKVGALRSCYQKSLQNNPDLTGSVRVRFLIQPTGAVTGVQMNGNLGEPTERCIVNNIASWRFPQGKDGQSTTVAKQWTFRQSK